jgi:hypothetical protein
MKGEMIEVQFDIFKDREETAFEQLEKIVLEVRTSNDKVRRGIYGKHSELHKKVCEIDERLKIIENNICQLCDK